MAGVVAGVDDLFFAAKFQETARHVGVPIVVTGALQDVAAVVREHRPALVILDLQADACRPLDVIRTIKRDPDLRATPVLGYFAHVQDDLKVAAEEAGCDEVLPRSALSSRLPDLLRRAVPSGAVT